MICTYDNCHEVESSAHNAKYCQSCKCYRKAESKRKNLNRPLEYNEEVWQLEEVRKQALADKHREKNRWIIKNKTLAFFDIESSNLNANFGEILCASIKPLGGKVRSFVQNPKDLSDKTVTLEIAQALSEYDYVLTWYGTKFDVPFLTTRLMANGHPGLGFIKHKDLYYTARFRLKLNSNRLAVVTEFMFGKTQKTRILPEIWMKALRGDQNSMNYIVDHCERDVKELEKVFRKFETMSEMQSVPLRWYG